MDRYANFPDRHTTTTKRATSFPRLTMHVDGMSRHTQHPGAVVRQPAHCWLVGWLCGSRAQMNISPPATVRKSHRGTEQAGGQTGARKEPRLTERSGHASPDAIFDNGMSSKRERGRQSRVEHTLFNSDLVIERRCRRAEGHHVQPKLINVSRQQQDDISLARVAPGKL
jgi:hypothetical protein